MTPPSVATLIVTYNSAGTIARCLDALGDSTFETATFVVDNASTDGTTVCLGEAARTVRVVESPENVGFAAACNLAMEAAAVTEPTYLLFVNPDAFLHPRCVELLVEEMERRPEAVVASPLITVAGSSCIWYAGARMETASGTYWHVGVGEESAARFTETTVTGRPTGCVMIVRAAAVDRAGPMDASYFLYWEDVEWSRRLTAHGGTVLFVPSATAEHEVSSSTGGASSKIYEYYYLRNRLRVVRETTGLSRTTLVAENWRESTRTIVNTFRARGPRAGSSAMRAIVLAYADFWRGRYGRRDRL